LSNAAVDFYLSGHDGAFGPFAAFTQPAFNQRLIQSLHE
jgi:hypothetical protein